MNRTHALIVGVSLVGALAACRDEPVNPEPLSARRDRGQIGDAGIAAGVRHYAKPGGATSGAGLTEATAWELQYAFNGAPSGGSNQLLPGDTVWLLGGDYTNTAGNPSGTSYTVTVRGDPGLAIVFRQKPGAIPPAVLKRTVTQFVGNNLSTQTLKVSSTADYTEFWDFEIAHTNTMNRTASPTGQNYELPSGIWNLGDYTKFVNLVIHDAGVAFLNDGSDTPNTAPEGVVISGCIIYNNGWDDTDRGHGHGLYLKNNFATMLVADNIIFNQFGYGIHIYTNAGTAALLNNIQAKGNISFNNGTLALGYPTPHGTYANLGNLGVPDGNNLTFERNMLFFNSTIGAGENLHYGTVTSGTSTRLRNYVVGGTLTSEGTGWPAPTQSTSDSTSPEPWTNLNITIARKTAADPNRANIVVYHGASAGPNVTVDLANLPGGGGAFLSPGDSFIVRNVVKWGDPNPEDHGHYSTPRTLTLFTAADDPAPTPTPSGTAAGPPPGPGLSVFVVTRVPPPPLSVTILGKSTVKPNVVCTYQASVTGGNGTYTYRWTRFSIILGTEQWLDLNTGSFSGNLNVEVWSGSQYASNTKFITVSPSAPPCTF